MASAEVVVAVKKFTPKNKKINYILFKALPHFQSFSEVLSDIFLSCRPTPASPSLTVQLSGFAFSFCSTNPSVCLQSPGIHFFVTDIQRELS